SDSVRAIPCPVDPIGRDTMKIARLAMITLVFDEEPDFAFKNVIDLLRSVHVRPRVVARWPQRDQKAALVAVSLPNDHRAFALASLEHHFFLRHIFTFRL